MDTSGKVSNQRLAHHQVQQAVAVVVIVVIVESDVGQMVLSQKTGKHRFMKAKGAKRS